MSDTQQRIDQLVKNNDIVLFMKGTASFPMCGFGPRDPDPEGLRRRYQDHPDRQRAGRPGSAPGHQGIQQLADHPAALRQGRVHRRPDIMMEMYESGELQKVIAGEAA